MACYRPDVKMNDLTGAAVSPASWERVPRRGPAKAGAIIPDIPPGVTYLRGLRVRGTGEWRPRSRQRRPVHALQVR